MPFSARRDSDAVLNFVSSSSISPNSGLEIKEPNRGKQLQLITNFGFADLLETVSQKYSVTLFPCRTNKNLAPYFKK